jgi:competence protein ComEC
VALYSFSISFLLIIGISFFNRYQDRFLNADLKVLFFDVGQGDGALIRFPHGKTALIDAGGGFRDWNVGKAVLYPELTRLGILTLDYAILSHPDQDHAYGFLGIFSELKVNEFYWNAFGKAPLLNKLLELGAKKNVGSHPVSIQEKINIEGVEVNAIPIHTKGKSNDQPLVILVNYGGCKILFTGDAESLSENAMVEKNIPEIHLLKTAHHGSKTSSQEGFLNKTRPKWAVISAGYKNGYGHPHRVVLDRLKSHGIEIFRTDFHGYLEFTFKKTGEVECRSAMGNCGRGFCSP